MYVSGRDRQPISGSAEDAAASGAGTAIQTRYNKNGVWDKRYKDIASGKKYLSVREWTGRPYNSEQREFAQYDKIGLQHITMTYGVDDAVPQIWIDGKQIPIEIVAKNDGLTVEQFVEWFFGESKSNVFEGVVLHFTSFRY